MCVTQRKEQGNASGWELVSQSKEYLVFKQRTFILRSRLLKNTQLLILLCSSSLSTLILLPLPVAGAFAPQFFIRASSRVGREHNNRAAALMKQQMWLGSCSHLLSLRQVLLNELGMDETFITPLREKYLRPITALLYPDLGGSCLDSHKAFVVKYSLHEDLDLSSHYDNAEVTLNVSLGKDFTEGNLYFGDFNQVLSMFLIWILILFLTAHSPQSFKALTVFEKQLFTSDGQTFSVPSPFI